MKDKLKYKEFFATVHFNSNDKVFYGKIEGISDLISFEGDTVQSLKSAFEEACEDYLQICKDLKKLPIKSYKGSFNVRIPSELHRKLSDKAIISGQPINRIVQNAIEREVLQ